MAALGVGLWFLLAPSGLPSGLQVIYLDANTLTRYDVDSASSRSLAVIRSPLWADLSPGGRYLAYLPQEEEDTPGRLTIFDTTTGDETDVGAGASGAWNDTGTDLAFAAPYGDGTSFTLSVASAAQGFEPRVLLEDIGYNPIAWSGDRIVLFHRERGEGALYREGEAAPQSFAAGIAGLWGVSPDGEYAITVDAQGVSSSIPLLGGARIPLDLGGFELKDGAWRPGTHEALAPLSGVDADGRATSRLVLIDASTGRVKDLQDAPVRGAVYWDPRGETFSYLDVLPGSLRLCSFGGGCDSVLQIRNNQFPLGVVQTAALGGR